MAGLRMVRSRPFLTIASFFAPPELLRELDVARKRHIWLRWYGARCLSGHGRRVFLLAWSRFLSRQLPILQPGEWRRAVVRRPHNCRHVIQHRHPRVSRSTLIFIRVHGQIWQAGDESFFSDSNLLEAVWKANFAPQIFNSFGVGLHTLLRCRGRKPEHLGNLLEPLWRDIVLVFWPTSQLGGNRSVIADHVR